jgi:hypothetical protein
VAETLVHIAVMTRVPEQIHAVERLSTLVGFDFFGVRGKLQVEVKAPRTKAQILELLRAEGEKYARVLEGAAEAFLGEQLEYPGRDAAAGEVAARNAGRAQGTRDASPRAVDGG